MLLKASEVAKLLGYQYKYFANHYQEWVRQGTLPPPIRMSPNARPKWSKVTLELRIAAQDASV